jgi:hypothetical protein
VQQGFLSFLLRKAQQPRAFKNVSSSGQAEASRLATQDKDELKKFQEKEFVSIYY